MTRLCFIHGWAYGPDIWTDIEKELQGYDITKFDLGFFGDEFTPIGSYDVVITHSYGLMWLLKNEAITFQKLVSISAIASFVKTDTLPGGVPKSQIRAMRGQLSNNPKALLEGFYSACGDKDMTASNTPNIPTLDAALHDMATLDLREKIHPLNVSALASSEDKIVSAELTQENFASKPILWHDSASHILPKTHPQWCANLIEDFINA